MGRQRAQRCMNDECLLSEECYTSSKQTEVSRLSQYDRSKLLHPEYQDSFLRGNKLWLRKNVHK